MAITLDEIEAQLKDQGGQIKALSDQLATGAYSPDDKKTIKDVLAEMKAKFDELHAAHVKLTEPTPKEDHRCFWCG